MPNEDGEGNPLAYIPDDEPPADGLWPAYSAEGVDLTQIRYMLQLTPAERLAALQSLLDFLSQVADVRSSSQPR